MEETFLLIKSQRDELIKRQNRDSTDGRTTITAPLTVTDEIANLKTELKRQKAHYEAQFIEYVSNFSFFLNINGCTCTVSNRFIIWRFMLNSILNGVK